MRGKAGITWYTRKDYQKLRSLFVDGTNLPESYDDWLTAAEEEERLKIGSGLEIVRIVVDPGAFSSWCKLKNISPDREARKRYVRHGALLGRPPKD